MKRFAIAGWVILLLSVVIFPIVVLQDEVDSQQKVIDKLTSVNDDWSFRYQLLAQKYDSQVFLYDYKNKQWQEILDNRDKVISWYKNQPPEIVKVVKEVEVEKEVPVVREVPVVKEIVVTKEVPQIAREFNSVDEAQLWLDANHLPVIFVEEADLSDPKQDNRYNCNDYAQTLQQRALEDGFLITYCPVYNGYVCGTYVTDIIGFHIGLVTRVNDIYYYVEAVPTHPNSFKLVRIINADRS